MAPVASGDGGESSTPVSPFPSLDMLDAKESKSMIEQLFPVFPELLDKVSCSGRPEHLMSSPCSWLTRLSYARILLKPRVQLCGRRYLLSPTCVSVSERSRPRGEPWGFCRNERSGSTPLTISTVQVGGLGWMVQEGTGPGCSTADTVFASCQLPGQDEEDSSLCLHR